MIVCCSRIPSMSSAETAAFDPSQMVSAGLSFSFLARRSVGCRRRRWSSCFTEISGSPPFSIQIGYSLAACAWANSRALRIHPLKLAGVEADGARDAHFEVHLAIHLNLPAVVLRTACELHRNLIGGQFVPWVIRVVHSVIMGAHAICRV
jgi:hypothetical protein